MVKTTIYRVGLVVTFVTWCLLVSAQWNYEQPTIAVLEGNALAVDSTSEVVDDKWGTPFLAQVENSYRKKAVVSLHLKENSSVVMPASLYCEVAVKIEWWDIQNNSHIENRTLSVSFRNDTLANDTLISYYSFGEAHKVKVTIVSVYTEGVSAPLPDIFVVRSSLLFERDYEFSCTVYPDMNDSASYKANQDELDVRWQTYNTFLNNSSQIHFVFEHMFQLEWTFFDDSSELVKDFLSTSVSPYNSALFRNNATRVTTEHDNYRIPLLYENGYLFFRIRSLKVLPSGQVIPGTWTSDQFVGDNRFKYRVSGHEKNINWQAATTFAEEGKRKSVASYFDGSSKNRQTVTKINTDGIAVVAETMYDFEGRPVVATLPAPSFDSIIHHFSQYNQNMLGLSYSWNDLDSTGNSCIKGPKVMSNASGASKYYSYNNPLHSVLPHSNIPESFGYPFSQTQYTGDLTNRVRASAGPGKDHNFGAANQRYTKYLYGTPTSSELNRMFGAEVGDVSHYFKNLVIDPNGQVSVTYQDMHGRTIATALSGDTVTVDLQKLDENSDTIMLKDAILDSASQFIDGLSIKSSKKFVASRRAMHKFYYSLFPEDYVINTCDSDSFCYDCVYDLNIRVTDECGTVLTTLDKKNYTPSNEFDFYFDLTCDNHSLPIVDSFSLILEVGEYNVSKTLSIRQEAIEYYFQDYISKDTCLKKFDEFYEAALQEIDFSGCNVTCASCLLALGDTSSFIEKFIAEILTADSTKVLSYLDTANAVSSYGILADVCDRLCDSFSLCDAKLDLMLQDMSPRGGQYAGYEYDAQTNIYTFNDNTSILTNTSIPLVFPSIATIPVYSTSSIVYYNELGIRDTVFIPDADGVPQPFIPNALTAEQFVTHWKTSWANSLLPFHPEYCNYLYCVDNAASHDYDQAMLNTQDYDSAVAKGFLNPLNDNDSVVPVSFFPSPYQDPFFDQSGGGASSITRHQMLMKMRSYINTTDGGVTIDYSLWQIAAFSASCAPGNNSTCGNCTKDLYWNTFRNIYLALKRQFMDHEMILDYRICAQASYSTMRNSLTSQGKQMRFETFNQILGDSISVLSGNYTMADANTLTAIGNSQMEAQKFQCSSYGTYWWNQLQDCGYALADSADIISRLVEVCQLGQDDLHVFGASTTAGDTTSHGFSSFDEVLAWAAVTFNIPNYPNADCNKYLINNPLPHTVVPLYYQTVQVNKPEQCICDNIVQYRFQYLHSGLSGAMSFATYLTQVRNVIISDADIQTLIDGCNPNACNILKTPVTLPYQFACNQVCVSCQQLTDAYNDFKAEFPNIHLHPNHMPVLQSYMNSHLGMNLTALEYLEFLYDSCGYTNFPPSDDSVTVPSFSRQAPRTNTAKSTGKRSTLYSSLFGTYPIPVQESKNTSGLERKGVADLSDKIFFTKPPAVPSTWKPTSGFIPFSVKKKIDEVVKDNMDRPVFDWNKKTELSDSKQSSPKSANSYFEKMLASALQNSESGTHNSYSSEQKQDEQYLKNTNPFTYEYKKSQEHSFAAQQAHSFIQEQDRASRLNTTDPRVGSVNQSGAMKPVLIDELNTNRTSLSGETLLRQQDHKPFSNLPNINDSQGEKRNSGIQASEPSTVKVNSYRIQLINAAITFANPKFKKSRGLDGEETGWSPTTYDGSKPTNNSSSGLQVQFSIAPQANWCDSVAASIADYDTNYVFQGNYSEWYFVNTMNNNLGCNYVMSLWLEVLDSCGLSCPTIVRCGRLDTVMQQFRAQYPQYADTSLSGLWTGYLNNNNASGNWRWYDQSTWLSLLNCCGVSYPAQGSLNTRCDSIQAVLGIYSSQGIDQVRYQLGYLFGWYHYDASTNQWIYNDNSYWLSQMDSCGISCSDFVNCTSLGTVMQQFRNQYPQYADSCLPTIWVNYLNNNNASGNGAGYDHSTWLSFLNCCGVGYPAQDSLDTRCDSILSVVDVYGSQGIDQVRYQLGYLLGWSHYNASTNQWIYNDNAYWLSQMDSCGISCSDFVNCTSLGTVMQQFRNQYPQYADSCLPTIWVNYLNNNNASGNGAGYDHSTWLSFLNCCGVGYPVQDSLNTRCDSIQAVVDVFGSQGIDQVRYQLGYLLGWSHYNASTNQWIYHDNAYWLSQMDSCGISCSDFVNCTSLGTVMQQFKTQYPQYADSCLPTIWVNYLNVNNASGNWHWYDQNTWLSLLNCCGVQYPKLDTLDNRCDSLYAITNAYYQSSQYNWGSYWNWQDQVNTLFGKGGDLSYWLQQLDTCNIPCSMVFNCGRIDTLMQQFYNEYPTMQDSAPIMLWVAYLNQHSGNWNPTQTWISILECCNVPYPNPIELGNSCDSITYAMQVFNEHNDVNKFNWGQVVGTLSNIFGWQHWDNQTMQFVNHDEAYWKLMIDSCHAPCPHIINCAVADSTMQSFYQTYPQYTDSCPPIFWVNYLNQNNASGSWNWYSLAEWQEYLNCCGISMPEIDSLSDCEILAAALDVFNTQSNRNIWDFEYTMGSLVSWGYNDSLNNWVGYNYQHWFNRIDSCGLPCPNIVDCTNATNLLNELFTQHPQLQDSCPDFIWVNYLNQNGGGNGNWYDAEQWQAILHCCGINTPGQDTLHSFCDSLTYLVDVYYDSTTTIPLIGLLEGIGPVFHSYYQDTSGNGYAPLSFFLGLLDSCGYSCGQFSSCQLLDSLLSDFGTSYPQYADSCPPFIIEAYLNTQIFGLGDGGGTYEDYENLLACCNISLPVMDTTYSRCDSLFYIGQFVSQVNGILIDTLGEDCTPAWLMNWLIQEQMGVDFSLADLCAEAVQCGVQCPDTCELNTFCDSLLSIQHIYNLIQNYNGERDPQQGENEDFLQVVNSVFGTEMEFEELQSALFLCDTTSCTQLAEAWSFLQPLFGSYDSCIPAMVPATLLNTVLGGNYNNSQWCNMLSNCGFSCPDTCAITTGNKCDTVLTAYETYLHVLSAYNVGDSSSVLGQIFSAMFGYEVTTEYAWELIEECDTSCGAVQGAADILQPFFDSFGDCVPSWVVELAYDANIPNGPLTYGQICDMLTRCGLRCPDTCGSVQPISCDSVIQLNIVFNHALEIYGQFWNDTAAIFDEVSSQFFGHPIAYEQFLILVDSCGTGYCHPELANFSNGLNNLFNLYGDCVPSWIVELAYNANLPQVGYPPNQSYGEICQLLQNCNIPCPDTCGGIPPFNCDSVLSVYVLWQNVINTFEGAAEDSASILAYIQTSVLDTAFAYTDFMNMVAICDTTPCDSSIAAMYHFFEPLISGYDSCIPAWLLEAIFEDGMNGKYKYNKLCLLLAACGLPCPDTCLGQPYNCDTVAQIYQTMQLIFASYAFADTNGSTMAITQIGLGISLNWSQFLNVYNQCFGNPEPLLCNRPLMPPVDPTEQDSCFEIMQEYAYHNAAWAYQHYMTNLHENFVNGYIEKCLGAYRLEKFDFTHPMGEYHFTLYYYDQAGNLVKTIPPAGFDITGQAQHTMPTVYRYNTLNQVVEQRTPDAGTSNFWYDRIGKLVVSRNQKQYHRDELSYTLYDKLQRIVEVGELNQLPITNYAAFDQLTTNFSNQELYYNLVHGPSILHTPQQVTRTYYDQDVYNTGALHLRNRVAAATYEDVDDFNPTTYQHASHYSYDIHGNVQKLTQENTALAYMGQSKKTIDYKYDLISGKVNEVLYQQGQPDQFIHKYEYDADNRLTDVLTSRDSTVFSHDAKYEYYLHGPLARTQLGGNLFTGSGSVQGLDYVYTLQGWLKGLNSSSLTTVADPGLDGIGSYTAPDKFGFTLGYYNGDFQPVGWGSSITAANHIEAAIGNLNQSGLYNGNIASMAVNIAQLNAPLAYKFRYDLLNRLVNTEAFDGLDASQNQWLNNTALTAYHNHLTYDPDGNILTNLRKGAIGNEDMDDMAYKYIPGTNKLDHVDDAIAGTAYGIDIDDQDTLNYRYDSIGNLTKDVAEGLDTILWTVYGKLHEIQKANGDFLKFAYDATGNRVMKEYWIDSLQRQTKTYYVRDATGNVMATYQQNNDTLNLDELVMYGSSRIGVVSPSVKLYPAIEPDSDNVATLGVSYYINNKKQYELTNHLGNVQTTIGDRRLPVGTPFNHYEAEVVSATDFYPFGMVMPERAYNAEKYRWGFNGKENDNEVKGHGNSVDFGARIYDTRIGRWFSNDPLEFKYPHISTYAFSNNSPIFFEDNNGQEPNQAQAIGLTAYMQNIRTGKHIIDDFKSLHIYHGSGGSAGPGVRGAEGRMLYSDRWGWIDMRHFASAAWYTDEAYITGHQVLGKGEDKEHEQFASKIPSVKSSAYDPEDLVSNLLGVYFEKYREDHKELDFTTTIETYFKELGVVDDISKIPGFDNLPINDNKETGAVNYSYEPQHNNLPLSTTLDKKITDYRDAYINWSQNKSTDRRTDSERKKQEKKVDKDTYNSGEL